MCVGKTTVRRTSTGTMFTAWMTTHAPSPTGPFACVSIKTYKNSVGQFCWNEHSASIVKFLHAILNYRATLRNSFFLKVTLRNVFFVYFFLFTFCQFS